jgi:hypothetical protein
VAKRIVKIVPYFGRWPEWINFYIESIKANPSVDWIIYTDCPDPQNRADNLTLKQMSFSDYKALVSDRLGIDFHPDNPYKLCDLKPMLGFLHEQEIAAYDYYAYGDIDVIYGDIRRFYTDELLSRYEMLTTHFEWVAGHFTLFENSWKMRNVFRRIQGWQEMLEDPEYLSLDEKEMTSLFLGNRLKKRQTLRRRLKRFLNPYQRNALFNETHASILAPRPWHDGNREHPQVWYWRDGKLTNARDGERQFLYLHFMNFKSNRYLPEPYNSEPSAWMKLDSIIGMEQSDLSRGFQISPQGFQALPQDRD